MRKEAYKVLISTALGVAAGLSACEATGVTSFIPDSTSKNPNSTEIDPTQTEFAKITSASLESITNNETKKSIIDSLPVNRPQSNGVDDVFSLKVGDKKFNFVMYELTDEEIANGVTIENSEGIKTVQSVATYTEFEGYDGTKSWVRLIGITSKVDNPSIVWFYDPNGFPTEERQIDTSRAVFGYDIGSKDNILYQPLITVPTSIAGYDYTQALPVILGGEVPPSMQVDVMYVKPESLLPQEVKEKIEQAGIDLTDMTNAKYDKNGLHITLESGEVIVLTNTDLEKGIYIGQDNVLQYRDIDGKNVVYIFNKETRKLEVEAIKEYSICKIERFYDCVVPYEDLENGDYLRWLKTLSKPFDQTKVKDVPFVIHNIPVSIVDSETEIIYDTSSGPNFADPSSAPFRRDVTSGVVYYYHNGVQSFGILKPIEFYDKNDPGNNKWVITVDSYYYADIKNLDPRSEKFNWTINTWKQQHVTPIYTTFRSTQTGLRDPLAMGTFERYPDMQARFEQFVAGDVGVLSGPGIILLTGTVGDTGHMYK